MKNYTCDLSHTVEKKLELFKVLLLEIKKGSMLFKSSPSSEYN